MHGSAITVTSQPAGSGGRTVSSSNRRTFAEVFSESLDRSAMGLTALHDELEARGTPVSLTSLSYWRAGRRQPQQRQSLEAIAMIEDILGLFPGELESLTTRGRPRLPRSDPFDVYLDRHETVKKLLAELGMRSPVDELIERDITIKYDLDERGRAFRITHQSVVEAVVNHARRRPAVLLGETADEPPLQFASLGGQRVGRVVRDQQAMVTVAEMILDEELHAGQTSILEEQADIDADPDDNEFHYTTWPRARSLTLWIRFHPTKVPARCEAFTVLEGTESVEELTATGHAAHYTLTNFGPGTLGIRWQWEDGTYPL